MLISLLLFLTFSFTISSEIINNTIKERNIKLVEQCLKIDNVLHTNIIKLVNLNKSPIFSPIRMKDFERISSDYGIRKHPIFKKWIFHNGIDIIAKYNTDILSSCKGEVIEVKKSNLGYGNRIVIKHPLGYETLYAHLNKIIVNKGDKVESGQKIGTMGSTGLSTGTHLHYEIIRDNISINPKFYLDKNNRNNKNYISKLKELEKI